MNPSTNQPHLLVVQLEPGRWYWEVAYYTEYGATFHTSDETKHMLTALLAAIKAHVYKEGY